MCNFQILQFTPTTSRKTFLGNVHLKNLDVTLRNRKNNLEKPVRGSWKFRRLWKQRQRSLDKVNKQVNK